MAEVTQVLTPAELVRAREVNSKAALWPAADVVRLLDHIDACTEVVKKLDRKNYFRCPFCSSQRIEHEAGCIVAAITELPVMVRAEVIDG